MSPKKPSTGRKRSAGRKELARVPHQRPGETVYRVSLTESPEPDGSSSMSVGLDVSELAVPEKRYAADVAGLVIDDVQAKLLFGQNRLDGAGLRSLIVVAMSFDGVHRFVGTCGSFIRENAEFMRENQISAGTMLELSQEPDQTVSMTANIATAARAGREATIDFYHVSPSSVHFLRKHKRDVLAVDAVVRVDAPLGVIAALVQELAACAPNLPKGLS